MKLFIFLKYNHNLKNYFLRIFLISILPGFFLSILAIHFIKTEAPSPYLLGKSDIYFFWQWLFIGVIIPIIESTFLVYPTFVASNSKIPQILSAAIGATPISLLHIFSGGLTKVIIVFWSFYVQSFAYLEIKKHNKKSSHAFLFVCSIHITHNSILITALHYFNTK